MTAINYSKATADLPFIIALCIGSMLLAWQFAPKTSTVVMEPAFIVADQCVVDE